MRHCDLTAILNRADAATPGPWNHIAGRYKHYVESSDVGADLYISLQELHVADGRDVPAEANATFIAASRSDVPNMVAEIKAWRQAFRDYEATGCHDTFEALRALLPFEVTA